MNENITTYGECRCCLTIGDHRDLMKEYEWNGTREVYFNIFLECFNVFLSNYTKKNTLICTSCILRLRDASSFKQMVLNSERKLDCILDENNSKVQLQNSKELGQPLVDIKIEATDDSSECSEINREIPSDIENDFKRSIGKLKNKNNTDTIRETFYKIKNNITEKLSYIHNTTVILENSNATPFKPKHKTGFPCFYCRMIFDDVKKMHEHQKDHTKIDLKRVLRSYGADNFVIYIDVTDLKCKICNGSIENFEELKTHLTKVHKKKFIDYPERVVPFKITPDIIECQICKCTFETFVSMERHMNVHYRNYVCEECGTGYVTRSRLKAHSKQHLGGSFPCETCKKVYTTPVKLKNHIDLIHKMKKRFKCEKCDERFTEYFKRQKHMVEKHDAPPLKYKCNVCEKSFNRKYMLSMHLKRIHLEERDYQCDMCSYKCFTKNGLQRHMIKHNGERVFECTVCKKSYARKRTLKEHMRIHNNDRRFACKECGQAFVQNCSLKGHIKTHHPQLL